MNINLIDRIKGRQLLYFVVKLIVFITILLVLDYLIGNTLKYLYFKQNSGLLYRTTYSLDSAKADIVIFGSSTANHNYQSRTFQKALNLSTYNTGRDGNSIFCDLAVLKGVLKRYSPRIAILDFYYKEFSKDGEGQADYDAISALLPYYENHPEIRSIIVLKSRFEKYKLMSKIYPYNSLIFTIAIGNSNFNKKRQLVNDENGYVPLFRIFNGPISAYDAPNYTLDTVKISMFKSFINECLQSKVKLYIFLSPKYIKFKEKDESIIVAGKIAQEYNIPFFDFTSDTTFLNHGDLFADGGHLNNNGAKIYTDKVIDEIIQTEK